MYLAKFVVTSTVVDSVFSFSNTANAVVVFVSIANMRWLLMFVSA